MIPLLQARAVTRDFEIRGHGPNRAVDCANLDVFAGDTLGLVGESGCGKTTLARCLLRLLEPTSGAVLYEGMDLEKLSPTELRRKRKEFQMIFQDAFLSLDPRMTIGQILSEPFEAQGSGSKQERNQWVGKLLDEVALGRDILDKCPLHLSGGQQQRVVIARALALSPRLIIADEPVSALDASVQAQILNLLAGLQRSAGLTLILIAHSLAVIHYLCTRIAVMYLGRIVEEAPAAAFFENPRHPYSKLLLQSMPEHRRKQGETEILPAGELPSIINPPPGCYFHPRCPMAMARCRSQSPDYRQIAKNIKVACFLYT